MQAVREIRLDCDSDAVLLVVEQVGGIACHTGRERCFFQRLEEGDWRDVEPVLKDPRGDLRPVSRRAHRRRTLVERTASSDGVDARRIAATIEARKRADPASSYVAALLAGATTRS